MRTSRIAALLLAVSAAVLWAASRMAWITVDTFDDKSGDATNVIIGGLWSTEQTAVAMLLLAGSIAGFALRRVGCGMVGVISALAGIGVSWAPLGLLAGEPDPQRAHQLLSTGEEAKIAAWAEIANLDVNSAGPALAMFGAAVALFGGVLLAMKPGTDSAKLNRYERKQDRAAKISRDLEAEPDSGRVMWDALDADIDPTDTRRP